MLSYPDFLEKQFIIIGSDEFKQLAVKNDNLAVYKDWVLINQISCYKIFCIFVIWDCTITTKLVNKLLEFAISIYFLTSNLKPKFIIWNQLEWNFLLRQKQYSFDKDLQISRIIIKNKISNQLELLKNIRDKDLELKDGINRIKELIDKVDMTWNINSLRWLEWNSSKLFFKLYFDEIWWYKRLPRTKIDIINLLMDIWYTFLYNFIESNLNLYGFDIYRWFYHQLFFERKSLVCDLIEPFRVIIDKQIKKIYNLWQINNKDFKLIKWEYVINFEKRNYYIKLLMTPILENKEKIFNYVKSYYKGIIKNNIWLIEQFYINDIEK